MRLEGVMPALTTPFDGDRVWLDGLRFNLERYARLRLGGYLVLGSTGEAVLLDEPERREVLGVAREVLGPDVTLIAGVSAESTRGAARQAGEAAEAGVDAVLVSTPHYFREQMTSAALVAHLAAVADASAVPVLLYNVPKFTGLTIPPEAVGQLSAHPNVRGMKDSSGDLAYLREVVSRVGPGFALLCGAAPIVRAALDAGACGAILAAATFVPEPFVRMASAGPPAGGLADAVACIAGRHGVPGIKAAMDARGLRGGAPRGPLLSLPASERAAIARVLQTLVDRGILDSLAI